MVEYQQRRAPRMDVVEPSTPNTIGESSQGRAVGNYIYSARIGKERRISSFEQALHAKVANYSTSSTEKASLIMQSKVLFEHIGTRELPTIKRVLAKMKNLGIANDIAAPAEFASLLYGIKADLWGERPTFDYPTNTDRKALDPKNPLNQIVFEGDHVRIKTLNQNLDVSHLETLLQQYYYQHNNNVNKNLQSIQPDLYEWVTNQAISRGILEAKESLRIAPINLDGATYVKNVTEAGAKQVSNSVEIWKLQDGRNVIVKTGPYHTLQAEILEQSALKLIGVPVPDTYLQDFNNRQVLVIGFLDAYTEQHDPFTLAEHYHTNRTLQRGLITDLWLSQYNRRPHNVMMKDGKIAFIDHGGALFCRATGGFKGFDSSVTAENVWDIVRTIPDNNPNGDVAVNEAYANVLTVEGGPAGSVKISDPFFLRSELSRLSKITNDQIAQTVIEAGFINSREQLTEWTTTVDKTRQTLERIAANSRNLPKDMAAFAKKKGYVDADVSLTNRFRKDLRWAIGAIATFKQAQEEGGMRNYLTKTLMQRRDNLVNLLSPLVEQEIVKLQEKETN